MPSVLDDYLSQIDDPALRAKIQGEFEKTTKDFGLVFERHQQEGIRMPKALVELGSKVIVEKDDTFHHVIGIDGDQITLTDQAGDIREEPLWAVTVAREFGDIMYPGLTPVDEIRNGKPGDPVHTVINGENYHALEMLQYTHAGKVDLIYIDPPYNTGNKSWKYNDRYVAEKDSYRHSKWLSFMEKRLLLAKKLLTPTGVIIVAIGDDEHHRLRMLMDQVFGSGNFISNVVWQGGRKNDSRYVSNGADYMLIYSRDGEALAAQGARWREQKPGLLEALDSAKEIWGRLGGAASHAAAQAEWRKWMKEFKSSRPEVTDSVSRYTNLDESTGEPIYTGGNLSWPNGGGPRYDVLHPVTGRPVKVPKTGWRHKEAELLRLISEGRARFGADETFTIQGVSFLRELDSQVADGVFVSDRRRATNHVEAILGSKDFPFPKDVDVIARWVNISSSGNPNAIVLDFFGGTGTTAEALMRLNAQDGGTRQAILITNNELSAVDDKKLRADGFTPGDPEYEALGVFHHVTKPRIATVVTGIRKDGSKYSDGLEANVAFFNLEYLDRARIKYGNEFESLAGVFWLRAGGRGPLIHRETLAQGYALSDDASIAVLFRPGRASQLAAAIAEREHPNLTHVFVVVGEGAEEQGNVAASYFNPNLTIERIYGSYLSSFQVNKKD
jgi:adenine-specific DNA-methyltransferase